MNIIVTGASRGIGFETVKHLAGHGHRILAIARSSAHLKLLSNDCKNEYPKAEVIPLAYNLTLPDLKNNLVPQILRHFKKVDILINNAGGLIKKPFALQDEDDFDFQFKINIKIPYFLTQYLLPHFSAPSHIVNISSMGGFQGSSKFPGLSAYSASKGALSVLTECLAGELKEKNIRVNCLALGSAQTEMFETAFPNHKAQLSAEEMAKFVAYFALNGFKYLNGKIIPVSLSTP